MKHLNLLQLRRAFWWTCIAGLPFGACDSRPAVQAVAKPHLISVSKPGELLYIDRLDNRSVLAQADTSGATTFCSFLVGLQDSAQVTDTKKLSEREKYLQYEMQQDWTALIGGDSVKPVFFQEKPHLSGQDREGALVFEIPRGRRADTLIYRDHFGTWGTQIFVLNEKQP